MKYVLTTCCALLALVAFSRSLHAEDVSSPPPSATPTASESVTSPAINSEDPIAATRAWLDTVPADKRAKSDSYFEGGYWLILWNYLMGVGIALFFLISGLAARMRDWTARATKSPSMQVAMFGALYMIVTAALEFPLFFYQHYLREHAYGLSTQTFGQWFREQLIGLGIQLVIVSILLMVLYRVFRRAPKSWWIWGTGVGVLFLFVGMMLGPVFIEPLFNTYTPLKDPAISGPILTMARANEIPVSQVFEVDASRQSNRVSANVAGFGKTTRIALNDNLLRQCSIAEIRAVMAHEMGHYILNHGLKLLLFFGFFIFIAFAAVRATFDAAVRRWGKQWRIAGIADPGGLPLLSLIFATVFFLLTPLTNTVTRMTEREADAFSINTAREPEGMAKVALKLGSYRKLNPGPVEEFFFFDHPSGRARIRMAMDWKAAHLPCDTSAR